PRVRGARLLDHQVGRPRRDAAAHGRELEPLRPRGTAHITVVVRRLCDRTIDEFADPDNVALADPTPRTAKGTLAPPLRARRIEGADARAGPDALARAAAVRLRRIRRPVHRRCELLLHVHPRVADMLAHLLL